MANIQLIPLDRVTYIWCHHHEKCIQKRTNMPGTVIHEIGFVLCKVKTSFFRVKLNGLDPIAGFRFQTFLS